MLNKLGIKHKLMLGFGTTVVIIVILLGLAYQNFARLSEASRWDRHTLEVMLETNKITVAVLQVQTHTRGFMLTGNESLVDPA
jgi:methyl-accepting chemotaxis protein WspA